MTIDDVISDTSRLSSSQPGVLDLSDSSGVSSEHDSTDSVTTATTGHRFTRSQYRVLQVSHTKSKVLVCFSFGAHFLAQTAIDPAPGA